MQPLLFVFGLVLLAGMTLGPIFGFVGWLVSRENRRRLLALENESAKVAVLARRLAELEGRMAESAPGEEQEAGEKPPVFVEPSPAIEVAQPADRTREDEAREPMAAPAEVAPAAPAPPPPVEPPSPVPEGTESGGSSGIEWERWIGLRGAAVLGGVVLALAALLFLKYSIETGLIPPVVRVALSVFVGLGAIGASQTLRKRGYEATANAMAGAGVVILYAAIWAARVLYGLVGAGVAYSLMTLVTVVCGLLSWRYRSLVVACLGLAGGFATPALLTSLSDNPIGLFTYILLLDLGLVVLARRRGWPLLGLLSLLVTTLYQAGWIFEHMSFDEAPLGLAVVAVFALLYTVSAARGPLRRDGESPGGELPGWLGSGWLGPGAAVSLAFAFALHLSGRAALGERLLPLVGLLLLLSLAAQWLGRVHRVAWLPLAAAGADVAVVFNWLRRGSWGHGQEWMVVGAALALAAAFHLAVEWKPRGQNRETPEPADRTTTLAAAATAFGLLLVLVLPPLGVRDPAVWPWVLAWLALGGFLLRQSFVEGFEPLQSLAALGLGVGFGSLLASAGWSAEGSPLPPPWALLAVILLTCGGFQALGLWRSGRGGRWVDCGAALLPLLVLGGLVLTRSPVYRTPVVFLGASLLLALLMVLAATRQRSGLGYAATVAVLALAHLAWVEELHRLDLDQPQVLMALALQSLAVILLTFWPLLAGRAFAGKRWTWYGAALAGPAWFLSLRELYEAAFGDRAIGLLPLALAGLSLFAAFRSRSLWRSEEPLRKSSLVWFAAVALGFVSLAVPLQLDREWVTVAWALEGFATLALWKRLDHPGLKYFSVALLAAVTVRLVANPAVLGYHPASGVPVLNWLSYTYLVPAACLLGGAYLLQGQEAKRYRPWEAVLYQRGLAMFAGACGLAAILVVFAWINLSIVDFFSTGTTLTLTFERAAARDLTTSLAWAVYAVVLLAIGIARGWAVLRWISLAFLVLTIGKVFLYDLGELEDLYRVASLVGLAVSLILVSLVYQRFVFQRQPPEKQP